MRRGLAWTVKAAFGVFVVWMLGANARGPFADESVPKELATGAAIVGAAAVLVWADRELEKERQ
jgi:hypothetical protein